jgi:hypothetical protein
MLLSLLSVGLESRVNKDKIVAIVPTGASPVMRQVQAAREDGRLIDCTKGRKTRSVIFLESGQVVISVVTVGKLASRWHGGATHKLVSSTSTIRGEGTI